MPHILPIELCSKIVGMKLEEALALVELWKYPFRIVYKDGVAQEITYDSLRHRINIKVVADIVTEAFCG